MADMVDQQLVVAVWKGWGIQVMVLLSFTLQVTLILLAGIRRHKDLIVLKVIIWSAYVLADTTAIYALGHMSLVSKSPEHQLMALWAPLLLVHLGGQDSITAYSIEDNRLWLRHLHTFGLQVLAVAYVLYVCFILGSQAWLRTAAILMYVVGVLKYGERVWALWCSSNSSSNSLSATSYKDFRTEHRHELASEGDHPRNQNLIYVAYTLLDAPKQLFEGPTRYVKLNSAGYVFEGVEMLVMVVIQLSMMYDLLYTKAAVVHTWYGRCIRVITFPATVATLLLFHTRSSDKDVYSRVDVIVTYVLLGGAVVLEGTSVLRAMFSRWTYVFLLEKDCVRLSTVVQRRMKHTTKIHVYMGQHNLFRLCNQNRNNTSNKIARWMGREDWWDSMFYCSSVPVPQIVIRAIVKLVSTTETSEFDITNSRGRNALRRHSALRRSMSFLDLEWSVELDLDESILAWHIATHIFIGFFKDNSYYSEDLWLATEVLSNYMFFLLAARPNMLPYPVSRQRYVHLCYDVMNHLKYDTSGDLSRLIRYHGTTMLDGRSMLTEEYFYPQGISANPTLDRGCLLAAKLMAVAEQGAPVVVLQLIFEVWVEMMCYTAYSCNENSHAKHLSSGGDIMTTISLLLIYMSSGLIKKKARGSPAFPDMTMLNYADRSMYSSANCDVHIDLL